MPDLLLELLSEEIPARMQARAGADLQKLVTDGLVEAGLTYESAAAFVTPRRLCLTVTGLVGESPTLREERKGPRVDAPEKALAGFLRATGLSKDQLQVRDDKKGQFYFAAIEKPGRLANEIIAELIPQVIRNFPWPKSMRWGGGALRWVRPLHAILCILHNEGGTDTVDFEVDGIKSCNQTTGHRFMAPDWFRVHSFEDYRDMLAKAYVRIDPDERAEHIWQDAVNLAFAQGMEVVEDKGLLAEVAGLVEWPVTLMGDIDAAFLDLPREVLQTSMREHQKFFAVRNPKSGRIEKFITVANRETADHGATILAGNRRVLAARLANARFFWDNDLRVPLEDMAAKLENVTFHNKLGSQADRIARIAALAREIAPIVGADADLAEQAANVAKGDLSSEMVKEFPELQGIMGKYYAQAAGLPQEVANACEAHYAPLGPSDDVPSEPVSVVVALADKIDTLTGFWAIDEKPTGSKDPFALRRAALGVLRLVLENGVRNDVQRIEVAALKPLLRTDTFSNVLEEHGNLEWKDYAFLDAISDIPFDANTSDLAANFIDFVMLEAHKHNWDLAGLIGFANKEMLKLADNLLAFFHDRLKVYLKDKGITHDVIDACLAMPGNDDFTLLVNRATALQAFVKTDDGTNLMQGFKRANNLLTQAEEKDGVEYSYGADVKFADSEEEKSLFTALDTAEAAITPAMKEEDFAAAMTAMAALRTPIDTFFEAVQVNTDNAILRRNRLNLLGQIRKVMGQVADFTRLEG